MRGGVTGLIVLVLSRALFLAYREANLMIFVVLPINSQASSFLDEVAVKFFRVVCPQLCGEYNNHVPRDLESLLISGKDSGVRDLLGASSNKQHTHGHTHTRTFFILIENTNRLSSTCRCQGVDNY